MPPAESPRTLMIEGQLRPNKITAPEVLKAFAAVPRESFVPAALRGAAYVDGPLPVGHGRSMLAPTILARMIQEADITTTDRVLDIGCLSGYAAAILAQLASHVIAVDADPEFVQLARGNLSQWSTVTVAVASGSAGYPDEAPYEVILVEGALMSVPDELKRQLADQGRLICGMPEGPGTAGEIVLFERVGEAFSRRPICDARLKLLPGFINRREFAL